MSTDVTRMYQEALSNTHAMEKQGLTQMEAQVKGLDDYPAYAALLRQHIAVTQGQLARLEAEIGEAGAAAGGLREAVTTVAGAIGNAVHAVMPDTVLKNLYAGYAYQYYQIGAYSSLKVLADAAGHGGHAGWIDQAIAEERQGAEQVEALIPEVTRTFIAKQGK